MTTQTVSDAFWLCIYELMLIGCFRFIISYLTKYDFIVSLFTSITILYSANFLQLIDSSTYYYKYHQIQSASSFISCYQSMI